jgi:hypothetical protein
MVREWKAEANTAYTGDRKKKKKSKRKSPWRRWLDQHQHQHQQSSHR